MFTKISDSNTQYKLVYFHWPQCKKILNKINQALILHECNPNILSELYSTKH